MGPAPSLYLHRLAEIFATEGMEAAAAEGTGKAAKQKDRRTYTWATGSLFDVTLTNQ